MTKCAKKTFSIMIFFISKYYFATPWMITFTYDVDGSRVQSRHVVFDE